MSKNENVKKYFSKNTSKTGLFRAEIKRRKLVSALPNKRSEKGGNWRK